MKKMIVRRDGVYGLTAGVCTPETYHSFVHSSGSIPIKELKSHLGHGNETELSEERIEKLQFAAEKHKDALRMLSI